jgi:hypothetical protein
MKRTTLRYAAAAIAAGAVLAAPLAQAQAVPNTPENRAAEAAKKGPAELRRFIQRTRAVYGLYFGDFYKAL